MHTRDATPRPGSQPQAMIMNDEPNVVLFFTSESFPVGTATTQKIGLEARALQRANQRVEVLVLEAAETPGQERNFAVQGTWNGVPFEYLTGTTRRAQSFLGRRWLNLRAYLRAAWKIAGPGATPRRRRIAFMFVHSGVEMTLLLLICRMSGVRSVIDLCEWRPALPYAPRFTRFSYESGLIFRLSFGIVAISRTLEERVLKLDPSAPRKLYRRTNLIDPSEFETVRPAPCAGSYLLWAGTLPAYEESVAFIIRAYADVLRRHPEVDLMLCGGASEDCKQRLLSLAATLGIHEGKVRFTGFILRDQLLAYYQNAAVLLIPLEDDERSRARFPFKLGEYLSAARPVVTSAVGDVPLYLTDGQSGMLCPAEDQEAFANAILRLLDDPESAERIGQAGFGVARREFDYRTTGSKFIGYLRSL